MTTLGLLLAFAVVFAAGSGLARLLAGRQHAFYHAEIAALSWLLGTGFVSLALWVLGFVLSGAWLVGGVSVGALGVALMALARGPLGITVSPGKSCGVDWLLIAVLIVQSIFIACWASRVALGWDGLMIWEIKARLAFESGGVLPATYFADADRAWSHPNYPLHFSYLETWFYLCLGACRTEFFLLAVSLASAARAALWWGGAPEKLRGVS